jgi:hypothetical protein
MKLTPWFSGDHKPVRVGVYQRQYVWPEYSYWDGLKWCYGGSTPKKATKSPLRNFSSSLQNLPWRGVMK